MKNQRLGVTVTAGALALVFIVLCGSVTHALAAEAKKITLADGHLTMNVPADWIKKEPRVRIIEHEYAAPAFKGDAADGRLTVMGAGGSVEQNIARWVGQFSKSKAVTTKLEIANQQVHMVDITGTYKDQRGPFAPATMRANYRMLGAIIVTEKMGQYFIKFYGPRKTVAANEKQFKDMLNSLKVK